MWSSLSHPLIIASNLGHHDSVWSSSWFWKASSPNSNDTLNHTYSAINNHLLIPIHLCPSESGNSVHLIVSSPSHHGWSRTVRLQWYALFRIYRSGIWIRFSTEEQKKISGAVKQPKQWSARFQPNRHWWRKVRRLRKDFIPSLRQSLEFDKSCFQER